MAKWTKPIPKGGPQFKGAATYDNPSPPDSNRKGNPYGGAIKEKTDETPRLCWRT